MLRAATPAGITQEVYALLITYQALRTAIADTSLTRPDIHPGRLSLTVALHAARDQVIHADAAITDATIDRANHTTAISSMPGSTHRSSTGA